MKSGDLNFLEPSGPLQAYNGTDLPFTDSVCEKVFLLGPKTRTLHIFNFINTVQYVHEVSF